MAADRLRGADPRDREGSVVAAPGHATRGRGRDRAPRTRARPTRGALARRLARRVLLAAPAACRAPRLRPRPRTRADARALPGGLRPGDGAERPRRGRRGGRPGRPRRGRAAPGRRAPGNQGSPACGHRRGEAPGSHRDPDRGRRRRALLGGRPTRGRGARSGGVTTKLTLQYDGAGFAGWAAQPEKRTVQGELEAAIGRILGAPAPVTVAGRTDAGVHAWGQVCSCRTEALDPVSLNALLPADVAVLDSAPAAPGFDARRDAVSRTYCYRVLHRRTRDVFERG